MTANVRWCARRVLVAVLVLGLSGLLPVTFAPSGARADSAETIVPILSPGSQAAWGFMVEEAKGLLAAHGVPAGKAENRARDEIRAFLVIRLIEIIEKPAAERTDEEKAALARLTTVIQTERGMTAKNAYQRFLSYEAPSGCSPSSNPEPTFSPACLLFAAFGDHPGVVAFTGSGFEETFETFLKSRARVPLAGALKALPYWSSLTIEGTAEENELLEELRDVYAEKIATEAAKEVVSEVISSIVELASGESLSPVGVTILGLSVAAIVGYGIWNGVDLGDVSNTLHNRADSAASESVDLSKLAEPEGLTELLYIIVSETLPQESGDVACTFDSTRTCHRFEFTEDPDAVAERFDSLPMPPHTGDEPHFEVRLKDAATFTSSADAQLPDVQMSSWSATVPADASGGYVVATNYDPTANRIEAQNILNHVAHSHVAEGLMVNSSPFSPDDDWRWSGGLDYIDWEGRWWIAWLQGGTFLHTLVATPLHGFFTPTDEISLAGIFPTVDGCVENPPFYFGALEGFNPVVAHRGTCLLTQKNVDIGEVAVGDRLLINGTVRTVRKITTCQRATSFVTPNDPCTDHGSTAIIIEPTGSTVEAQTVVSSLAAWGWRLIGLGNHPGFGNPDNLVMKMADHDTCAGYDTCPYPAGDVRNCRRPRPDGAEVQCYQGPTIEYEADAFPSVDRWSATLVPALKANPDAYVAFVNGPAFSDNSLQVDSATGVLLNDVRPTQTATVVTGPSHGTLSLSTDGSFRYTPEVGYGANSPQHDEFTYRICDGGNVVPDEPDHCSEAVVSLTVENAPPTASVSWFGSPDEGHQVGLDYTYHDREGDRQGISTYAWYRDDQTAPVGTNRTYFVTSADVDHLLWFSVTPVALTGTSPGAPAFSDKRRVSAHGTPGLTPADLVVNCGPFTTPVMVNTSRTCTATVTRDDDTHTTNYPTGNVFFRSLQDGAFSPASCALTNFQSIPVGARSSCSVTYTPHEVDGGIHTVVGLWIGQSEMDEATSGVTVAGPGPAPTAANDAVGTDEDTPLSIAKTALLANDTGTIDAGGFSVKAGTGPSHGTLVDGGSGSLLYTPAADFHGGDGFGYQVCDGAARCASATVTITVASVNDPPAASATTSATSLECSSAAGATASFDGSSSSDVDSTPGTNDDIATFEWFEDYGAATQHLLGSGAQLQAALALGTHVVTLKVTDHAGAAATAAPLTVIVADTPARVLVCPAAGGAIECTSGAGTPVTLVASATDACGGTVTIANDRTSGGADASDSFPLGTTTVGFTAKDASGNESRCTTPVVVQDTTPPALTVALDPHTLWPPNHRMVDVQAVVTVSDACGAAAATLTSVTSSEPDDAVGLGDGHTTGDIQGAEPGTADVAFSLRAERDGAGAGRAYTVVYTATDASGHTASAIGTVFVPHDERAKDEPVSLTVDQSDAGSTVAWQPVTNALQYTVVRGDVANLRETDTAIDLGAVSCVRTGPAALSTTGQEDAETPPPGHAFFYLVGYDDGWGPSGYGTAVVAKPRVVASGDCR